MSEEDKLKTNNEKVTINDYYYYYLLKCEDALNELEKYIEESYEYNSKCLSTIFEARAFEDNKILDKLQELKGSE